MSKTVTRRNFIKLLGAFTFMYPMAKLFTQSSVDDHLSGNSKQPNFIIVLFDAFTAQHMSLYGYKRNTTPNIERFAEKSTVFHRHYSASSHTKPSTSSMLTGVYPWSHRAFIYYTSLLKEFEATNIFSKLPVEINTLAFTHNTFVTAILSQFAKDIDSLVPIEKLALYNPNKLPNIFKNDYPMGFFATKKWRDKYMGSSNSLFISPIHKVTNWIGVNKILEEYKNSYPMGLSDNQEGYLYKLEDAINWIKESAGTTQTPFLGYFHLLPPHEAYRPRVDFLDKFANDNIHLMEKPAHFFSENISQEQLEVYCKEYDEYIALVDSEFGRLYHGLEKMGVMNNTYLIMTSDHGQLFERGIHGHGEPVLYESGIHIPLIIRAPGQNARKDVFVPTSNTDITPTILHITGNSSEWCEGKILPSLGGTTNNERIIFSMEAKMNYKMKPITKATFSAIQWPYNFISHQGYGGYDNIDELYNLESDPEELSNLAGKKPTMVSMLKEEMRRNQMVAEKKYIGA